MAEIAEFCRRWDIRQLEAFGSILRDDFRPDSDIDFLYTPGPRFRRDQAYGPWMRNNMAEELSELLGRKVDLNTAKDLSPYFRQEVLDEAEVLYVTA